MMERDGIERGRICVLSCVEPCQTYALRRDARTKHLLLVPALRKCLHLYFYFVDRAGIGYQKQGNCFTRIDDLARAQQMMDDLKTRNWCHFLNGLARRLKPRRAIYLKLRILRASVVKSKTSYYQAVQ